MAPSTHFASTLIILFFPFIAFGQHEEHQSKKQESGKPKLHQMPMAPGDCAEHEVWDYSMATCRKLSMPGMPMSMWMIHGNGFLVQTFQEGQRGRDEFAIPNMIMSEVGRSLGDRHEQVPGAIGIRFSHGLASF